MINKINKKWFFAAGLSLLLLAPRGAHAIVGTVDNVPAATLLVPYFEVDLSNPSGLTTLFSVNNASATAILAKVTMWTDLGVPTLSFNVYLTGYDVQTINVRDLLNGTIAPTASAGQDPQDAISPKGQFSQDINFATCTGQLPAPALTPDFSQGLRNAHTGAASSLFAASCGAQSFGDNIARGYITVDTVNQCSTLKPGDAGYFSTITTTQNVLWGDYFFLDPNNNFAKGDALVHIEASTTSPLTTTANAYTFYGQLDDTAWSAEDHREALGSTYAARFLNGGTFTGGSQLVVWRDSRTTQSSFTCGVPPAAIGQQDLYAFDEQETPFSLNALAPFPARTQKVQVNSPSLPVAPTFGWLYMNLNHGTGTGPSTADPAAAQSFVAYTMDASGRFSVGQPGVVLESASTAVSHCLPGGSLNGAHCQ
jgi:hypothetical protein